MEEFRRKHGNLSITWWSAANNPAASGGLVTGDNLMAYDDLEITVRD